MYGSGVRTGTGIIHLAMLLILKGLLLARAGWIAAAAGTTTRVTAGRRIVTAAPRASGTAAWAFALPGYLRFWFFTFLPFGTLLALLQVQAKRSCYAPAIRQAVCVRVMHGFLQGCFVRAVQGNGIQLRNALIQLRNCHLFLLKI